MFPSLLTIVKDLEKEVDEDEHEKVRMTAITMGLWEKKAVDRGCIIMYKAICNNCKGNGYTYVTNTKETTEPKQCWMCESTGEINWSQAKVDDFIYNTYFRKRMQ